LLFEHAEAGTFNAIEHSTRDDARYARMIFSKIKIKTLFGVLDGPLFETSYLNRRTRVFFYGNIF
jgi:hypothetical protein